MKTTTNEQTINELETELEEIKDMLKIHGIPTVEEYEADKVYWREIAVEHYSSKEQNDDSIPM